MVLRCMLTPLVEYLQAPPWEDDPLPNTLVMSMTFRKACATRPSRGKRDIGIRARRRSDVNVRAACPRDPHLGVRPRLSRAARAFACVATVAAATEIALGMDVYCLSRGAGLGSADLRLQDER